MFVGGMALVREPYGKSLVLGAMVLICCVGALALGRLVWPAALGSLLVLAYWALEMLVWRLAQSRPGAAVGVALAGSAVRLAFVAGVLITVGIAARDQFVTSAAAFLVTFTVYEILRLVGRRPAGAPARTVEAP